MDANVCQIPGDLDSDTAKVLVRPPVCQLCGVAGVRGHCPNYCRSSRSSLPSIRWEPDRRWGSGASWTHHERIPNGVRLQTKCTVGEVDVVPVEQRNIIAHCLQAILRTGSDSPLRVPAVGTAKQSKVAVAPWLLHDPFLQIDAIIAFMNVWLPNTIRATRSLAILDDERIPPRDEFNRELAAPLVDSLSFDNSPSDAE